MSQSRFASVVRASQTVVVALLLNPRAAAAALAAVALVASLLLGSDSASAGWSTSPGKP